MRAKLLAWRLKKTITVFTQVPKGGLKEGQILQGDLTVKTLGDLEWGDVIAYYAAPKPGEQPPAHTQTVLKKAEGKEIVVTTYGANNGPLREDGKRQWSESEPGMFWKIIPGDTGTYSIRVYGRPH